MLPAAFAPDAASKVAKRVLHLVTVLVAGRLSKEGLELVDGFREFSRLLVEESEVVVRVGEVAAALVEGLAEGRLRARVILLLRERDAEPQLGLRVATAVLLDGLAQGVRRLLPATERAEQDARLVEGVRVFAAAAVDGVAVGRERLLVLPLLLQGEAEVVLRHGVVAAALLDCLAELFGRGGELAFEHQRATETVVRARKVGLQGDGLLEVSNGRVVAAYGEEVCAVIVKFGGGSWLLNHRAARRRVGGRERPTERLVRLVGLTSAPGFDARTSRRRTPEQHDRKAQQRSAEHYD